MGRPNPGWFARPWFKDVLILKPMTVAQASFCLIVSGFVIYEVFTEWKVTKELLLWTPHVISMWLKADGRLVPGTYKIVDTIRNLTDAILDAAVRTFKVVWWKTVILEILMHHWYSIYTNHGSRAYRQGTTKDNVSHSLLGTCFHRSRWCEHGKGYS